MLKKVGEKELCNCCKPSELPFNTTDDISALKETIGQERALRSIEFGLDIDGHGFNLYVLGESGTGKLTTIKSILTEKSKKEAVPDDRCYVFNFKNPDLPRALSMSPGVGIAFQKDMDETIMLLRQEIPKILDSKEFEKQRADVLEDFQAKQKKRFSDLEREAAEKDFTLKKTANGLVLLPVKKTGEALSEDEYEDLEPEAKEHIDTFGKELQDKLDDAIRVVRKEEKKIKHIMKELEQRATLSIIAQSIEELKNKYSDNSGITKYLDDVREDILEKLDDFKPQEEQPALPFMQPAKSEPSFIKYKVNIFVDNSDSKGAPVVIESNPTYYNLFGRIEHKFQYGMAVTDFTMIKAGSLQKANGGYLVVDALELLKNVFSYDALKRAMKDREIKLEDIWEQYRLASSVTLKPEALPFNVKIVLIGSPRLYYLLYNLDEEYSELFKVKADYENRMTRNSDNTLKYAEFVRTKCEERGLMSFDSTAVARVIDYGSRLAEHQNKLSAKFSHIAEIIKEADYWSKKNNNTVVNGSDVEKAIEERIYRSNKVEKKIQEATEEGTILVDMKGAVTGQINGLSVLDMGDYRFGMPSRITARSYAGRAGIINIEREIKMSGKIHEKAVLILIAYLGGKYASKQPMSLTASLTFEQLYGGVEGDSATCAEVYALLSSISGVPIKQSIAITGSMNQHGEVQPIGGVNEKIEGFYDTCKINGLDGNHGVIIPKRNLINLMLRKDVVEAVENGEFSIYSIDNIEDGIETLTDLAPGEIQNDGTYPEGTFNFLVAKKLKEFSEAMKSKKDSKDNDEDNNDKDS